jgi:aspartyl-tRNA(Asn)/glutamyl-tRNA(Gln) amidotransferase subunit A
MRFPPRFQVRRLSPVDVVEAYLGRIEAHEPKLQAFVDIYAEDARLAAAGAEKAIRSGHAVGPLHGIPIALKDLIEIEGKTVTGGCEIWKTRKAARTATLARRLIAHGLIVLGKTHTVEFAMGGWGTNTRMGTALEPMGSPPQAHTRRLEQRLGSRSRGGARALGGRHRHRRFGAPSRLLVRHHRS